ncbi:MULTISPECIES: helix-turn-helix domain-containing protein [Celeribacter]|jgi:transcriptional regulator with XRE-family HTH domain|uniref:helix-turn-helix domain-containing protein n=1 Tax=Celeribacter TaxID=875170 RepID=UPI001C088CA0|nr:XRE family transcriptional regulator [Celeribacter halophilus]MBU2890338.1 XRE family transcriptional regulator [Celeribacter halophilus]MDO6511725.1 XRE family transcriptional regulator [Celeribacter halophilus]MDO6723297.1 XRE family transcriptional regulator [Celeribacter halophilus]
MSNTPDLGQDIRALRTARKMTLETLAQKLGKSLGWVSQVERNLSTPTMDDLRDIARVFDVPLSLFFGTAPAPEKERGRIVRASARRHIGAHETGLVETLISPDLTDDFEVIHSTFQPGAAREEVITRPTTEVAYMISGTLELWIDGEKFTVSAGDSFRIRGDSYRWANPYDTPAIAVWVISPPVY